MLGFTLAASILTGLLCGVVPALRATDVQLDAAKKLGTRGLSAESRCNTQRFLVASQIAFVFVLLVTASWFSGGLRYLALLNLGYDQDEVVRLGSAGAGGISTGAIAHSTPAARRKSGGLTGFPISFLCDVRASQRLPDEFINYYRRLSALGRRKRADSGKPCRRALLFDGWHASACRARFTEQDKEKAPLVAIVNQSALRFARREPGFATTRC